MLLAEMAACGVPSACLQWPGTDPTYYCLPFEDFGIARLRSVEALESWLVADPVDSPPGIRSSLHATSIERITARVLDEAERSRKVTKRPRAKRPQRRGREGRRRG